MIGTQPLWNHAHIYSLSWSRFEEACQDLYAQISTSNFRPDLIVGIARGGLVPSVRLSHMFGDPALGVISIRRNAGSGRYPSRVIPIVTWSRIENPDNRRVLLVDDIAGSGDTLHSARQFIGSNAQFKSATLVVNANCAVRPDFFVHTVDDWVVFPWESSSAAPAPEGMDAHQVVLL